MKKYIILIILFISLNSCTGYNGMDFSKPVIISQCESSINGYTIYTGHTSWLSSFSLSTSYVFRDVTDKFNVGDTIKISK